MATYTVDTGGTGLFTSLANAISSLAGTITEEVIIQCSATTGLADTTAVDIYGFTGSSLTNHITVEAATGHEAGKQWDATKYRLEVGGGNVFGIGEDFVRIKNIQLRSTDTSGSYKVINAWHSNGNNAIIENCIIDAGGCNGGIYLNNDNWTWSVNNCIVYATTYISSSEGVYISAIGSGSIINLYNSIVTGFNDGIELAAGTINAVNCAVFNNADDFDGTVNAVNCASDDGDGTNPVTPTDWDTVFNDLANYDFTLLATDTDLRGAGVGPGSNSNVPTLDIDGDTRSGSTCDIGPDEYFSGGSTTYDETGLNSTITGVTDITDLQQYQETASTNINALATALDLQQYQETLQAIFTTLAAVNDHQAYIESLGFVVQSVTSALDALIQNLVETLAFTMSTQTQATDHQKYIEQLTTAFNGLIQATDRQKYVESLNLVISTITAIADTLASSFSESLEFAISASINGTDHQNYIETLVSLIMTETGLNEINHFVEQLHTVASMATTATERGHYIELLTDLWNALTAIRTGFHPLGLPFFKYGFNADYMPQSFEKQPIKKEFERFSQRHFNA